MAKRPKVGDIFSIPLADGKMGYGQYLHYSKMGPIIQIFNLISDAEASIEEVISAKPLFPPIITGLFAAIKDGSWRVIGNRPVPNFVHPKFLSTLYDPDTGRAGMWFLWDGEKDIKIGTTLSPEYKEFEFLVIWTPQHVVDRIETGKIPFPYGELIKYNKFTPLK